MTQDTSNPATPTAEFIYDTSNPWGWSTYDNKGRLSVQMSVLGTTGIAGSAYSYDSVGRVAHLGQCSPVDCGWGGWDYSSVTYNLLGEITSYNHPYAFTIGQSYDVAGQLSQITSSASDSDHPGTLATINSYFAPGEIQKITLGNGLTQSSRYDSRQQPCRLNINSTATVVSSCTGSAPSGNIQDFQYGFNYGSSDNGNVASWNGSGQQAFTRSYTYDNLNRLSSLSDSTSGNPCPGLTWTYDAWGNRTDQTITSGSCGAWHSTVSTSNRIASVGSTTYTYDAVGNLTYDGTHHYYYNAENQLIQVDGTLGTCSTAAACYVYDPQGHRAEKLIGTTATEYIYDLEGHLGVDVNWTCSSSCTISSSWNGAYLYMNGDLFAEYTPLSTRYIFGRPPGVNTLSDRYERFCS